MYITILGREEMSKYKASPNLLEKNVVISVNDRELLFKTPHKNLLSLVFQDITPEIEHYWPGNKLFTKEQAAEAVEFIENRIVNAKIKPKNIVVHCAAGISRSAAIATYIAERVGFPVEKLKQDRPIISPNLWVLKLLREATKVKS